MGSHRDRPGRCLDCNEPILGIYNYTTGHVSLRCPTHAGQQRSKVYQERSRRRVAAVKKELDAVGVREYCRLRYESDDDVPVRLIRKLNRAPILEYFEFARPANFSANMTPSRLATLELMAQGLSNKEIADEMGISISASADRVRHTMKILKAKNRPNAIHQAHLLGLLDRVPAGESRTIPNYNNAQEWTQARYDVLFLLAEGCHQNNMAATMGMRGRSAVRDRIRACFHLLGATNAANAIHRAHQQGFFPSLEEEHASRSTQEASRRIRDPRRPLRRVGGRALHWRIADCNSR